VRAPWPPGFQRIPDEDWTRVPVDTLAVKYDAVEKHGWYANLDPTVEALLAFTREGAILVDYSGGTGILIDRLLRAAPTRSFGIVNVDSSPKFLALSLEKLRADERTAFRLIRYLKDERRLQTVDEVLGDALLGRGVDGLVSTNAIHLYYDLVETLASWRRVLRDEGRVFVQSGNIRNPQAPSGAWIIDDTVEAIQGEAQRIVRDNPRYQKYADALDEPARMEKHRALREKFFLPPRPLSHYLEAFDQAGLRVLDVKTQPVAARTHEWLDFLRVYHEGVLGWVGGTERIEGRPPTDEAVQDRLAIMGDALARVMADEKRFTATWTYITAAKA
jgi:SAM-dependent methyltransferase